MDHDRTAAPLTADEANARARQLITEAYAPPYVTPTSHRDETPLPAYGPTPPVAQPGRPPMSQKATDASALMLFAGIASVPIGGSLSLVLYTVGHVDPVVVGIVCAAPVLFLSALSRVIKGAKAALEAAPADHHHHNNGVVIQDHRTITVTSTTRGLVARTSNDIHN
ncbi:hypothetical protein [Streptomyces goshikiensis]|uniref:hypothetical protein n=1 Tax=Streptomyces goshikiensis TaxID=1942 RepID=UPI0022F38730|nr:hypothetical protein [Streptomyces goshikiensis]WBY25075.1 hypothetical protein PET44_36210 [Streptomyces goshikiensis]